MVSRFRERLTFANVASSIALFAALSTGGAYAADKIGSKDIDKNAVKSKHLKNAQVKGKDVAADAIDSSKVGDGSLLAQDFGEGQLPAGPKGDQGPKGDTGPQGPAGITGTTWVSKWSAYNSNSEKSVTATCPSGYVLTGTGADLEDGTDVVVIRAISPSTGSAVANEVTVRAMEQTSIPASWAVMAHAICAKLG